MSDENEIPRASQDTPALPESTPDLGQPDEGDNQDVEVRKVYPTDPTGAEPE